MGRHCLALTQAPGDAVGGIAHAAAPAVEQVRGFHGRANVLVADQFLDGADGVTVRQQVRRKRLPKRVARHSLAQSGLSAGLADRILRQRFLNVMTSLLARALIHPTIFLGKHRLPTPVPVGIRVLAGQSLRQFHSTVAVGQILLVDRPTRCKCFSKGRMTAFGGIVTQSLSPLRSRTVTSPRSKSRSFTRSRIASNDRERPPHGYDKQHVAPEGKLVRTLRWMPAGSKVEFDAEGKLTIPGHDFVAKAKGGVTSYVPSTPETRADHPLDVRAVRPGRGVRHRLRRSNCATGRMSSSRGWTNWP